MNLDFNSSTLARETAEQRFLDAVDQALLAEQATRPPRQYIGGSFIGEECSRRIQWQALGYPADPGKEFPAQTLRIFERGHRGEDMVATWLVKAGFHLRTQGADGRQFGFKAANGAFAGHADGVIVGWLKDGEAPIKLPALWENKVLGAKAWGQVKSHGVKKAKPVYYAQVVLYQHYLQLTEHPAVFTFLNADTMQLGVELVTWDGPLTQELIDKAARIVQATKAGEDMPRASADFDSYVCRFCPYTVRCHG